MKTYRAILSVGIISLLFSGCSSSKDQKTEIEEGLSQVFKESGVTSYFDNENSSTGDTLVIIGNDTNYTAETVMETTDGKALIIKIHPKEVAK